MIQPQELRIGNWVRIRDYPLCVKAIADKVSLGNDDTSEFVHDQFDYSNIDPVPLTPETLEACGLHLAHAFRIFLERLNQDPSTEYRVRNLHQLQNLYFALKGQELVVNITANQSA